MKEEIGTERWGDTTWKWWSWDLTPGLFASKAHALPITLDLIEGNCELCYSLGL